MRSMFIGRKNEIEKITTILKSENSKRASIISIGGPGGVGKSTLLEEVLDSNDWDKKEFLIIRIDGNAADSIETIVKSLIKNAKSELKGGYGYFKETEKVLKGLNEIDTEIEKKFRKEIKKKKKLSDSEIDSMVTVLFALGKGVNKISSKSTEYLDFEKVEAKLDKDIKNIWRSVNNSMSDGFLSSIMPDIKGKKNYRARLLQNPKMAISEALVTDLHTILYGAKDLKSNLKPTQSKVQGISKLIVVIEDYENKQHIMNDFLIEHFIPMLKKSKFDSLLFIVGRDIVSNISSEWIHKLKRNIEIECDLDKFTEDEAISYIKMMGINDDKISEILIETDGYPWLLEIEIENLKTNKGSAHTNKMFYDRTTKWMSDLEKKWFDNICYLENVNLDTLKFMLPEFDSNVVYDWFENEASIRDTSLNIYTVRSIIKGKVLKYLEVKSPSTHEERMKRAQALCTNLQ